MESGSLGTSRQPSRIYGTRCLQHLHAASHEYLVVYRQAGRDRRRRKTSRAATLTYSALPGLPCMLSDRETEGAVEAAELAIARPASSKFGLRHNALKLAQAAVLPESRTTSIYAKGEGERQG